MKLHNVIQNHALFKDFQRPVMKYIQEGNVKVNGKRRRTNRDVNIYKDTITVSLDDRWVDLPFTLSRTIVTLYKPRGVLCTHSDPFDRKTIYQLIPDEFHLLRSAGRLDQDSEGLLVLSDDGYFIFNLISPQSDCEKVYLVGLERILSTEMINKAESGECVIYRDGLAQKLLPVSINVCDQEMRRKYSFLELESHLVWYTFTLKEGKYRQIRKMCDQDNNPVVRLIRIQHKDFVLTQELCTIRFLVHSLKTN